MHAVWWVPNRALEPGEVTTTTYVCNGTSMLIDGGVATSLVAIDAELPGANCVTGGSRIRAGVDANENGTLDAAEVTSTSYACNGAGGGGSVIRSGIDTNGDGTLQTSEATATTYTCHGAGSVPAMACSGAGRALQWDGSQWQCVTVQNTGLSQGRANGFEARDDWGDVWDGFPRAARTWAEAEQICTTAGARLPTVTELWRNRASWGTGNISTPNDGFFHWTIAPSYRPNYYVAVYLSNNTRTEAISSTRYAFRCIWKSQRPAGFSGNRCFGRPGTECASKNTFYNMDTWSRAPQYLASAVKECELENASVMTTQDYEEEIMRGTTFFSWGDDSWPQWHWTLNSNYHDNGYSYASVLRWTDAAERFWSATAGRASHAGASNWYTFRCVGKKDPTSGSPLVAMPACQNNTCFSTPATGSRNRLTADNVDRPAANWLSAFKSCRAVGGHLPTDDEFFQLIKSGWANAARQACEDRGGRLPLATELYRLRFQQGVVPNELGQSGTATLDSLWTLNPSYRANFQIQVRLSDGSAREVASDGTATAPYRCIWPATQPEAFSGHACYGLPSNPCFEVERMRTDRYPRASLPQAAAQWECRFLGGRLPTLRETAEFQQAGLPNSVSGVWEWTPEWAYHTNAVTYLYLTSRGTNPTQADWKSDNALNELSWSTYDTFHRFRCVFSDIMD